MKNLIRVFILCPFIFFFSCQKDFLDAKPDKTLTVPNSLYDLQALLDNSNNVMNFSPNYGLFGSDDIYITDVGLASMTSPFNSAYLWEANFYNANVNYSNSWNDPYEQIFYANVVLETLNQFQDPKDDSEVRRIRGSAYFFRAFAFYQIAQLFCGPYERETASSSLGIPLRLAADVSIPSERASIEQTYQQIISDLKQAVTDLPFTQIKLTRPNKLAAYALLARTFLVMGDFPQAEKFASLVLSQSNVLLNYNDLDASSTRPFPKLMFNERNPEVLFFSIMNSNAMLQSSAEVSVDTSLFHSYDQNDLRKELFFRMRNTRVFSFKGQYSGTSAIFSGLALDEVLLTRAESRARLGNLEGALVDLNQLLEKRWKSGTFTPFNSNVQQVVLMEILRERRKELVYRDLRWTDLRRLNLEVNTQKNIQRIHKGQTIELRPNDPKYTLEIPPVVMMYSNLEQNPR